MGIVYKARHRKLQRVVALKVTRAGDLALAGEMQRFQVEVQAVAKLDHPTIVPIFEAGEVDGRCYFSMALVEGQSLAQRIAERPLPPREAAELMRQVAGAIAYAHAQGVIHRDLKPGNILMDRTGQPRVTDFGLAKRADADSSLTQAGQVMGTPSYMSPEQAEGKTEQVGTLADVYSLGATLYCLLTGRPPFQAASVVETLKQVVEREPVPPRQLNPAVDRDLETICLKCLEKRPERRYVSATALADDLKCFLEDRPIQARRASELEKLARWCRRNRLVAASLGVVIVVFLTAFALVSWSYWRAEDARRDEAYQRGQADLARDAAQEKEKAERWERYRANIVAAASALQLHNIESARRALDGAPSEHRNWEWRHLHSQLDEAHAVADGTENSLWLQAFHGRQFVFSLTPLDGKIRLVDPVSDRTLGTLPTKLAGMTDVVLSPTAGHLACSEDGTIRLWDVPAGSEIAVWQFPKGETSLWFSPDGRRLVVRAGDGTMHLLNVLQPRKIALLGTRADVRVRRNAFSADGRRFAMLEESHVTVWDITAGKQVADIRLERSLAFALALNQDGTRLLIGGGFPDNAIRLWDVATGKQTALARGHTNYFTWVEFSPSGAHIASCSPDQTVRLWDGKTLQPLTIMRGHTGPIITLAFSPDGKRLVTWSDDRSLRLWDAATGELVTVLLGQEGLPRWLAFSQDGAYVIAGDDHHTCRLWNVRQLEQNVLRGHTSYVYDVAFSADGTRLASAAWDSTVRIWDAATGTPTAALKHDHKIVGGVAFSPDGKLVASVARDKKVWVWDMASGKARHIFHANTGGMTDPHAAFNGRGTLLAQGGNDGWVHFWDPVSGALAGKLPPANELITDVAFSRDGSVLASAGERTVRLWDVATRKPLADLKGHQEWVERVAFSPDGRVIASASRDKTARIWDSKTYRELAKLDHGSLLYGLAFSPDNSRLATACADNTVRLWDLATYQEVAELRWHAAYVHAVAFSPDGTRLVSASGDHTLRIWDMLSARERAQKSRAQRGR